MDDGHRYNNTTCGISISPNRVNLKSLSEYFTRNGLMNYYPGTTNSIASGIKFTPEGTIELMRRISKYIIPEMQYKLLDTYQGLYEDFDLHCQEYYLPTPVGFPLGAFKFLNF